MLKLSERDKTQTNQLRASNVLCELDSRKIESSQGTIFVGCPDGDQFQDIYEHHCLSCNGQIRHHPLCLNGGALLLSKHSPIPFASRDGDTLMRHIRAASRLKGIHTIALYVHAPCGVAAGSELDIIEVVRLLIEAKQRLRQNRAYTALRLHCFVHVDFVARKRTYFVDRLNAISFLKTHNRSVRE